MDRERESKTMKCAWIDDGKRIISFTNLSDANSFYAEEPVFWQKITLLMKSGYRVQ